MAGTIAVFLREDYDGPQSHHTKANQAGPNMDLMEISEKSKMSSEEAAKTLHKIADSLERHNELEFVREGIEFHIDVPNQVQFEIELEVESDESSIEIEISW